LIFQIDAFMNLIAKYRAPIFEDNVMLSNINSLFTSNPSIGIIVIFATIAAAKFSINFSRTHKWVNTYIVSTIISFISILPPILMWSYANDTSTNISQYLTISYLSLGFYTVTFCVLSMNYGKKISEKAKLFNWPPSNSWVKLLDIVYISLVALGLYKLFPTSTPGMDSILSFQKIGPFFIVLGLSIRLTKSFIEINKWS
tara:strand:+ start:947 stop:1546 length:600 start_codon:yes stop_codon:yes gene_type:complete